MAIPIDRNLRRKLEAQGKQIPVQAPVKSLDAIALEIIIQTAGFPAPQAEYRFALPREWRFDYAWPDLWLAVELEGGIWLGKGKGARRCPVCRQPAQRPGRHNDPLGFINDLDKYNQAAIGGWTVLRFANNQIRDGRALDVLDRAFFLIKKGIL